MADLETALQIETKPPRLTRRFIALGAIVILLGALLMVAIDRRIAESQINHWAEANNVSLTTAIANSIWPRYADFVSSARESSAESLQGAPRTKELLREMRSLVSDLRILKVKLYDLQGLTVFSSQIDQIGADYSANSRFIQSVNGGVASKLEFREEFQSFTGVVTGRWVLSSYVPVRAGGERGEILGVAEIYKDVSHQRLIAAKTLQTRAAIIGIILLVVFAALVFVVWKCDLQIAAHQRREIELRAKAAEAEAKSEAKSRFLANMSHEIRTPMNGVLGTAGLLANTSLDARQQQLMATIQQSGESLLSLVDSILDLSKIESGSITSDRLQFEIDECVQGVVDLLEPGAKEKGLRFHYSIDGSARQSVLGDPQRLRQVLINLVSNAIKFTAKGEVMVLVSLLESSAGGSRVRFEVRDSGIGIAKDQLDKVFESFHQVDNSISRKFGGTGLGLGVARDLVELMGGQVGCTSTEGEGSTFWFELSFDQAETDGGSIEPEQTVPKSGVTPASAQILLAEDNDVNLVVTRESLVMLGYTVDVVNDGAAAVSAWECGNYQLILMDIQMPNVDGRQAARQIRAMEQAAKRAPTPIIALTAHSFEGDRESCLEAGMDEYLTKPFRMDLLADTLRSFIPGGSGVAQIRA